ncbi:hypothetical protein X975_25073, partial [Stegodyphus mimosarum]
SIAINYEELDIVRSDSWIIVSSKETELIHLLKLVDDRDHCFNPTVEDAFADEFLLKGSC